MPLTRSKQQILVTMKGVKFLMADRETEVPCTAAHELLAQKFGSGGERDQDEKAFRDNRAAIEQPRATSTMPVGSSRTLIQRS